MPQGRISKRSVDALVCPREKDREFLWDNDLAGFGVSAFKNGKKVYVLQYRQHGRSRRVKIGQHGRFTPEEARNEAKKLLGSVAQGSDPVAGRRASEAVPTFREIAHEFIERHVRPKKKARTLSSYDSLLNNHILPAIGSVRVADLRRSQISKLHHDMAMTPGAANRALSVVSAVWNWAAAEHEDTITSRNPAEGIAHYPEQGRERFLTRDELSRLGEALGRAETEGLTFEVDQRKPKAKHAPKPENRRRRIDPFAVAAIRLLILTGARLNEIMSSKWEYVDLDRGLLRLPDSKTGKKPIYLSSAALAVLSSIPQVAGNPYLIAGERPGSRRADLKKPWAAITKAADLEGARLHDLRHSFASIGAGESLGLPIIGKLLGHSQPATTARYAHLDTDPMRRAVDTIGARIDAAMRAPVAADEVIASKNGGGLKFGMAKAGS